MADYNYITDTGVIVPDTSDLLTTVQEEYKQALGTDLNLDASTPQGRLIAAEVEARTGVLENNAKLANVINPDDSFGIFLDALAALTSTQRLAGSSSRVLAQIQGVPNTVIPAGSRAKTVTDDVFYLENAVTIPASGMITAYFLSEQLGAVACPVGTLTKIIDAVLGWETITNNVPAELGTVPESDASLKIRRKTELFQGSGFLPSVKARLSQVPNLRSSFAYENNTNAPIEYEGIMINAHSVYVVADGGTDTSVAQAIFDSKSDGCGYTGTVTANAIDSAYGLTYPVQFNRPTVVACQCVITVLAGGNNQGTTSDIVTAVKNAVLAYEAGEIAQVEGLEIGVDVSPFEISSAVTISVPDIFVGSVLVSKTGDTPAATTVPININEVANIAQSDITVNVV